MFLDFNILYIVYKKPQQGGIHDANTTRERDVGHHVVRIKKVWMRLFGRRTGMCFG